MLLIAYRGFSGNPGLLSETGLYQDGRAALKFLQQQSVPNRCLILLGNSLGSGVAVQLATETHVGAVILKAPYTSLAAVGKKHYPLLPVNWLLKDRYDSIKKITKIHAPLLIVHGRDDHLIPVEQGEKLYQQALPPKRLILLDKGHYNFVIRPAAIEALLPSFIPTYQCLYR